MKVQFEIKNDRRRFPRRNPVPEHFTCFSTIAFLVFAFILSISASGCAPGGDLRNLVHTGNKLFAAKKYDESMKIYHDAEIESPKSPIVHNNIGNVFYKTKNFTKSEDSYRKSISESSEPQIVEKAHYNLGNALFRQDKLDQAILEYESALKIDPDDVESKYNLEYARIKLKEKLAQQAKKQQQQNNKEKHRLPDERKQQNKQCKNPKSGQGQKQPQPSPQKQAAAGGNKENRGMNRAEAEQILKSIDDKEKHDKKKSMIPIPAGEYKPEKDW
jgi:Ca-activated chloride channel homolog